VNVNVSLRSLITSSQSNVKGPISTSLGSETPERNSMKRGIYNYVVASWVWPHMQIHVMWRCDNVGYLRKILQLAYYRNCYGYSNWNSGATRFIGARGIGSKVPLCLKGRHVGLTPTLYDVWLRHWLLAHSANFIKLTFDVVSRKISLARLFCALSPAAPRGNCPLCSP